jgi:hypothetical protein
MQTALRQTRAALHRYREILLILSILSILAALCMAVECAAAATLGWSNQRLNRRVDPIENLLARH